MLKTDQISTAHQNRLIPCTSQGERNCERKRKGRVRERERERERERCVCVCVPVCVCACVRACVCVRKETRETRERDWEKLVPVGMARKEEGSLKLLERKERIEDDKEAEKGKKSDIGYRSSCLVSRCKELYAVSVVSNLLVWTLHIGISNNYYQPGDSNYGLSQPARVYTVCSDRCVLATGSNWSKTLQGKSNLFLNCSLTLKYVLQMKCRVVQTKAVMVFLCTWVFRKYKEHQFFLSIDFFFSTFHLVSQRNSSLSLCEVIDLGDNGNSMFLHKYTSTLASQDLLSNVSLQDQFVPVKHFTESSGH